LYYENLKLYIQLGMKLLRIRRVVEFSQRPWMRPYVELCTQMRRNATSDFEKDFWKLCVNATFGKSMENLRNRVNIRLIHDPIAGIKAASKPTFLRSKIINTDLVMVQQVKQRLVLNKPIYTGFCILELSKCIMYDFYYNQIVARYGPNQTLLATDTDSLILKIKTHDLYTDMAADIDAYDTSNFEETHPLYSTENARVLGKFKSETGSQAPKEFIGLRAKMYSLDIDDEHHNKLTANGIKRSYVAKHVHHSHFLKTLETKQSTYANYRKFGSTAQQLETLEVTKVCLSAYDDKRFVLDNGSSTRAYGHFRNVRV